MQKATDVDQQVELLAKQGLAFEDEAAAKQFLTKTTYYRFATYSDVYRQDDKTFVSGATFEWVRRIYELDSILRSLIWTAVGDFEIAFRSHFADTLALQEGPLAWADPGLFRNYDRHQRTLTSIDAEMSKSNDPTVIGYADRNPGIDYPIWMVVNVASMGSVANLFGNIEQPKLTAAISAPWQIAPIPFPTVVLMMSELRNLAAHHSQLWHAKLKTRGPRISFPIWLSSATTGVRNSSIFWALIMLVHLHESSFPTSSFRVRINKFLSENGAMWNGLGVPPDRDKYAAI
ncbi:Abi family protein [Herbiconiux solani]|uniref:Abi family protein n=1 Tax=Herbiconiux solani TaxID=661329 RepID=UPI0009FC86E1|nr:Abi family protein [Herbiconiux solani]